MDKDDLLLIDSLKILGLSKQERDILIFLAEISGGMDVKWLGLELEIPRQTAYSTLCKLENKGLLRRRKQKGISIFFVNRDSITNFANEKARSLQEAASHTIRILKLQ